MIKRNFLVFLLSLVGLIILLGFLTIGRCTKLIILDNENKETSYLICKGELVGKAISIREDKDINTKDLLEKADSGGESYTYFNNNIFNKGYSNNQVINMIENYLKPQGMKITTEDQGFILVGFKWIVHKFSNK